MKEFSTPVVDIQKFEIQDVIATSDFETDERG